MKSLVCLYPLLQPSNPSIHPPPEPGLPIPSTTAYQYIHTSPTRAWSAYTLYYSLPIHPYIPHPSLVCLYPLLQPSNTIHTSPTRAWSAYTLYYSLPIHPYIPHPSLVCLYPLLQPTNPSIHPPPEPGLPIPSTTAYQYIHTSPTRAWSAYTLYYSLPIHPHIPHPSLVCLYPLLQPTNTSTHPPPEPGLPIPSTTAYQYIHTSPTRAWSAYTLYYSLPIHPYIPHPSLVCLYPLLQPTNTSIHPPPEPGLPIPSTTAYQSIHTSPTRAWSAYTLYYSLPIHPHIPHPSLVCLYPLLQPTNTSIHPPPEPGLPIPSTTAYQYIHTSPTRAWSAYTLYYSLPIHPYIPHPSLVCLYPLLQPTNTSTHPPPEPGLPIPSTTAYQYIHTSPTRAWSAYTLYYSLPIPSTHPPPEPGLPIPSTTAYQSIHTSPTRAWSAYTLYYSLPIHPHIPHPSLVCLYPLLQPTNTSTHPPPEPGLPIPSTTAYQYIHTSPTRAWSAYTLYYSLPIHPYIPHPSLVCLYPLLQPTNTSIHPPPEPGLPIPSTTAYQYIHTSPTRAWSAYTLYYSLPIHPHIPHPSLVCLYPLLQPTNTSTHPPPEPGLPIPSTTAYQYIHTSPTRAWSAYTLYYSLPIHPHIPHPSLVCLYPLLQPTNPSTHPPPEPGLPIPSTTAYQYIHTSPTRAWSAYTLYYSLPIHPHIPHPSLVCLYPLLQPTNTSTHPPPEPGLPIPSTTAYQYIHTSPTRAWSAYTLYYSLPIHPHIPHPSLVCLYPLLQPTNPSTHPPPEPGLPIPSTTAYQYIHTSPTRAWSAYTLYYQCNSLPIHPHIPHPSLVRLYPLLQPTNTSIHPPPEPGLPIPSTTAYQYIHTSPTRAWSAYTLYYSLPIHPYIPHPSLVCLYPLLQPTNTIHTSPTRAWSAYTLYYSLPIHPHIPHPSLVCLYPLLQPTNTSTHPPPEPGLPIPSTTAYQSIHTSPTRAWSAYTLYYSLPIHPYIPHPSLVCLYPLLQPTNTSTHPPPEPGLPIPSTTAYQSIHTSPTRAWSAYTLYYSLPIHPHIPHPSLVCLYPLLQPTNTSTHPPPEPGLPIPSTTAYQYIPPTTRAWSAYTLYYSLPIHPHIPHPSLVCLYPLLQPTNTSDASGGIHMLGLTDLSMGPTHRMCPLSDDRVKICSLTQEMILGNPWDSCLGLLSELNKLQPRLQTQVTAQVTAQVTDWRKIRFSWFHQKFATSPATTGECSSLSRGTLWPLWRTLRLMQQTL